MTTPISDATVGLIGYGEVGETLAAIFHRAGATVIVVNRSPTDLRERLTNEPYAVADSISDLAHRSDLVVSAVWPKTALSVAEDAASGIDHGCQYLDLNSVSPPMTRRIQRAVTDAGGRFVKGVIMGSVGHKGSDVTLYLAGDDHRAITADFDGSGFDARSLGTNADRSAAFKMFHSLITKGFRELFVEMLVPAREYDLDDRTLEQLSVIFEERSLADWVRYSLVNTTTHAERRAGEIEQVRETVEDLGYRSVLMEQAYELHRFMADEGIDGSHDEILEQLQPYLSDGDEERYS